jgi:hypothetical protein
VSTRQTVTALLDWHEVKRLLRAGKSGEAPLAQRIGALYLKRFGKPLPDFVVPLRQDLREARERERAEARERRRRKRQSDRDHLEAMRVSMLALRHMYGGVGANENPGQAAD